MEWPSDSDPPRMLSIAWLFLHVNRELIHHEAEITFLLDLHRGTAG